MYVSSILRTDNLSPQWTASLTSNLISPTSRSLVLNELLRLCILSAVGKHCILYVELSINTEKHVAVARVSYLERDLTGTVRPLRPHPCHRRSFPSATCKRPEPVCIPGNNSNLSNLAPFFYFLPRLFIWPRKFQRPMKELCVAS